MVCLFLKVLRPKSYESTNEDLDIFLRSKDRGKNRENDISKSHGRTKSPGKMF
jgi:hypothetical protein